MKTLILSAIAVVSMTAVAEEAVKKDIPFKDLPPEKRIEIITRYEGGRISKPGSVKGKIVYINAQTRAPKAWMSEQIAEFNKKLHYKIEIQQGEFSLPSPKLLGEANLFIVDDEKMPSLLSAPENRWVMVNVAPLAKGNGEKPQFFEQRVKKELTRGLAILSGAQDSAYANSLLTCMTTPEELDTHIDCKLPVDIIKRFKDYLARYGITPEQIVPYRMACQAGWAPQPTNEIQKAVWDEIHALPKKPIRIKPETKKVNE